MTWTTRPRRTVDISAFDLTDFRQRQTVVLLLIRAGHTITEAAPMAGMAVSSIHSARQRDAVFSAKLRQAQADARAMDPRKLAFLDMLARGVSQMDASIALTGGRSWSHSARRGDPAFDNAVRAIVPSITRAKNGRDIESQFEVYALAARIIRHLELDGVSVAEACRREGVSARTVSAWNERRPFLHERIMAARAKHAKSNAYRDAALARWAKWRAERGITDVAA